MRKKLFAAFYMIFLFLAFVSVPLFVVKKTLDMKSGWHGIPWGSTESQVSDWVKKNNTNYDFEKCPLNHYGVLCRKLTWKKNRGDVPFDSIEFQFRNGKLYAVIESEKVSDFDPSLNLDLGRPAKGSDIKLVEVKEKGVLLHAGKTIGRDKRTLRRLKAYKIPRQNGKSRRDNLMAIDKRLIRQRILRRNKRKMG